MAKETKEELSATSVLPVDTEGVVFAGAPLSAQSRNIHLDGYELISELGHGGMGMVFLARQQKLNRLVAIKSLKVDAQNEEYGNWLAKEAITMAALNHPNIVGIYGLQQDDKNVYIIMEYIPGHTSIRDLVTRFKKIPEELVIRILISVVDGLMYIHSKKFIHRDMKPDNVLVYTEVPIEGLSLQQIFELPETRIKICDFGIARHTTPEKEKNKDGSNGGSAMGSPNYMAPEQCCTPDETDFRSDIYALAGTAIFMLTGKPPFQFNDRESLMNYKMEHDIPTPLEAGAKVSSRFSQIIAKMGRLMPDERYQSYPELLDDLKQALERLPSQKATSWAQKRASFWKKVNILTFAVILLAAFSLTYRYIHNKYFKVRMISLSSSMGYWTGERSTWQVSQYNIEDKPMVMTSLQPTQPIRLLRPIHPGQCLDFSARHPVTGEMLFEFSDDSNNHSILKWNYLLATKKNSFVFNVNGSEHIIEDIQPKKGNDWLSFHCELLPKGIVLYIEDELVCMVRTTAMTTTFFTVQLTTTPMASLKHIYIYDKKK
ncbi:MAG: serine/threonine protein kinase [Victivallales bacterium]|nr:serine/threonine protein kinase [Victivallales bacterium]